MSPTNRRDGGADSSCHSRDAGRGRSLFGMNNCHRVGLPRRNVHLADAEPQQQNPDRKSKRGHERQQNKQNIRRQMGEDHRSDEANP